MGTLRRYGGIAAAATGPTTIEIEGSGAHKSATFWIQTIAGASTTSDWTVALQWHTAEGLSLSANSDVIAKSATDGIDATVAALTPLTMQAPFAGTPSNAAIPAPNLVVLTRGAGSNATSPISAVIYAYFAD